MHIQRLAAAAFAAGLVVTLTAGTASAQSAATRFVVAPQGNEARYFVREQLAGIDFPSDAVGRTSAVEGALVIDANGAIVRDQSRITIQLGTLATDSDRRDNFVRNNILQTAQHPTAVFVPTELKNLRFPLPPAGDITFQMVGDLTIRGVTRPVTWDVTATTANGSIRGEAKTKFTFADFTMTKPRVRSVLSVDDDIRLEYSFFLVPAR
ncbi:MAG TPA: YceI family protein [Longimicrobiales bacterium]|nr:YceI family protein [Longimicrobiales bacterium]